MFDKRGVVLQEALLLLLIVSILALVCLRCAVLQHSMETYGDFDDAAIQEAYQN